MTGYSDILVIRNPIEGAAFAASLYSHVPVINAGDGGHLHPTQTLTDLMTITEYRGSLSGLKIGFCGDLLNGRTVHSLLRRLSGLVVTNSYLFQLRSSEFRHISQKNSENPASISRKCRLWTSVSLSLTSST